MSPGLRAAIALALYVGVTAASLTAGPAASVRDLSGRFGLPEERPSVTPAAVSMFLGRIGVSGRSLYQRALFVDFIPPLLFAATGWAIVDWSRARASELRMARSIAMRLVVLVAAIESIENLLLLSALGSYPGRPLLGGLIGLVVQAKFVVFPVSCAALAAVLAALSLPPARHAAGVR